MQGPYFPAVAVHCPFPQVRSAFPNTSKSKSLTRLRRALGGGLFLLVLLVAPFGAFSAELTLAWDPNSEADLAGYGVYFSKDAPGPPYDLFGNVALAELSDPANPAFTLTGLEKGSRYYITLTAYDAEGNESEYADPVCAEIGDEILPCDSAPDDGGSESGDGSANLGSGVQNAGSSGGGSGCFIAASSESTTTEAVLFGLFLLAAIFFQVLQKVFTKKNPTPKMRPMIPSRFSVRREKNAGDR